MADETNTQCSKWTEDWNMLAWKDIQKNVFRLQRRNLRERYAFLAASQNDTKRVHDLQRSLLRSWSARCLAVRRVTQDNAYASHP